jgi:cytochrome b involved in lipid metabolism
MDEVKKHNTEDDCWMVLFNKVYNPTEFLPEHPGGSEALEISYGADGTKSWLDQGHGEYHLTIMEQYIIGKLKKSEDENEQDEFLKNFELNRKKDADEDTI